MFGVGYIESVLTGQSSERSLMNGHERLSVWGIVDGDEAALLKPVARALLLRDALRTHAHGGLEFGPGARALLKGGDALPLVLPPRRARRAWKRYVWGERVSVLVDIGGCPIIKKK